MTENQSHIHQIKSPQDIENFGRLVWDFLADRRCDGIRKILGTLYTSPNYLDIYENHLRCAALLTRKPLASRHLSLNLANYDNDGSSPCKILYSKFSWIKVPISTEWFEQFNIFGQSISSVVKEYRLRGVCKRATCQKFMIAHDWGKNVSTIVDCMDKTTIWRTFDTGSGIKRRVCCEGNKRMHSLAWRCQMSNDFALNGWNAWMPYEPQEFNVNQR